MKAISPVGWFLVCLLSVFNSGAVIAASSQDTPVVAASTATSQGPESVNKTTPVKKTPTAKKPKPVKKRAPIASKSTSASEIAKTPLPPVNLDLSLPQEMVKQLQPLGALPQARRAPLLPKLLGEKPKSDSPFQLNGRLLNNEMGLQRRNEERRDVEGAVLDFEFKR